MLDAVLAVVFIAILVAALVTARSIATFAVLVAAATGVSGVLLQFLGTHGTSLTYRTLQTWLLVTLLAVLAASIVTGRRSPRWAPRSAFLLTVGVAVVLAVGLLASRALAPGSPELLSSVGYLVTHNSAEDNAKWLNTAAQLASGAPIDTWANVGGPLVLLLTLAATILSAVSQLVYGGVNEVAVSGGTLIFAEMFLICIAPFAVAPVIEARHAFAGRKGRSALPWPFLLLSVIILVSATTLLLYYGHLTLQFTLLILTLWIGAFVTWRRRGMALLLTTAAVVTTAEVWFPLSSVSLLLVLGVVAAGVVVVVRGDRRRGGLVAGVGVGLLVLMWSFLTSSIAYSLGIGATTTTAAGGGAVRGVSAIDVPSLPLFSNPGGTEIVSTIMALLTIASVIGAYVGIRNARETRTTLRFLPIVILAVYVLLVTLADFWAVGKGPGYASSKLTFAVAIPSLVATLPIALTAVDSASRRMTALRWFAVGAVVVLLVFDTFIPRALVQVKPALWPTVNADPKPYWWPGEVRGTADQSLASNPIGCLYLPPGADRPSVLPNGQRAYACTRLLTGLAGQSGPNAAFVSWTLDEWLSNESQWDHYQQYFAGMPESAKLRTVILLDDTDHVVGIDTIERLMTRYPAVPTSTDS